MTENLQDCKYECPVEATVSVIGGKWKPQILYYLYQGTQRHSDLKRGLPTITQRMLTLQLRELERDGIVQRTVYAEVPPKVEYSLTKLGQSLAPVMDAMVDWGEQYLMELNQRSSDLSEAE
jgi:DNA-binding HxlR family transcriptional regulator